MSTHLKEKVEKIEQIITKLVEESAKGKPIVVEGKKDALSLQELGVSGAILTMKTGGKSFREATLELKHMGQMRLFSFWILIEEEGKAPNVCKRAWNGEKSGLT